MTADRDMPAPVTFAAGDVVQVVMTDPIASAFQSFLRARRLYLAPCPSGDDDLPTFIVGLAASLVREIKSPDTASR